MKKQLTEVVPKGNVFLLLLFAALFVAATVFCYYSDWVNRYVAIGVSSATTVYLVDLYLVLRRQSKVATAGAISTRVAAIILLFGGMLLWASAYCIFSDVVNTLLSYGVFGVTILFFVLTYVFLFQHARSQTSEKQR